MGLDMYANRRAPVESTRVAYWRKHNRLHGWMEQLWRDKTGREDVFNCEEVTIELSDLIKLEEDIQNNNLPRTKGCFFGDDSYEDYKEYYEEDDLKFIKESKQAISEGDEIVYSSWW